MEFELNPAVEIFLSSSQDKLNCHFYDPDKDTQKYLHQEIFQMNPIRIEVLEKALKGQSIQIDATPESLFLIKLMKKKVILVKETGINS